MINKIEKEVRQLKAILYGKDKFQGPKPIDMVLVQVSSWKDNYTNIHTFIYSENEVELVYVRYAIEKIYEIFTCEGLLQSFWETLILDFEEKHGIDFVMLISYVYMETLPFNNNEKEDRVSKTVSQVAYILFKESRLGLMMGPDVLNKDRKEIFKNVKDDSLIVDVRSNKSPKPIRSRDYVSF